MGAFCVPLAKGHVDEKKGNIITSYERLSICGVLLFNGKMGLFQSPGRGSRVS
jgi:hypothetical protein